MDLPDFLISKKLDLDDLFKRSTRLSESASNISSNVNRVINEIHVLESDRDLKTLHSIKAHKDFEFIKNIYDTISIEKGMSSLDHAFEMERLGFSFIRNKINVSTRSMPISMGHVFPANSPYRSIKFSPNGTYFAICGSTKISIYLSSDMSLYIEANIPPRDMPIYPFPICFSENEKQVFISIKSDILIYHIQDNIIECIRLSGIAPIFDLAYSFSKQSLMSFDMNGYIIKHETNSCTKINTDPIQDVSCIDYSYSLNTFIFGRKTREITIADPEQDSVGLSFAAHTSDITSVSSIKNQSMFASGCADGIIKLWEANNRPKCLCEYKASRQAIKKIMICPLDKTIITFGHDRSILFYNYSKNEEVFRVSYPSLDIIVSDHHPGERMFATLDTNGKVIIWKYSQVVC